MLGEFREWFAEMETGSIGLFWSEWECSVRDEGLKARWQGGAVEVMFRGSVDSNVEGASVGKGSNEGDEGLMKCKTYQHDSSLAIDPMSPAPLGTFHIRIVYSGFVVKGTKRCFCSSKARCSMASTSPISGRESPTTRVHELEEALPQDFAMQSVAFYCFFLS
ncbi:hypothetical protein V6N13_071891 [Hibiscus sabdariffa]